MALLTTWLSLELLYVAQLWTYTGATHTEEIKHLWTIFLKLWIFKDFHILHFSPMHNVLWETHYNESAGSFGSHAKEPMQSWIVHHRSALLSSIACLHYPVSISCRQSSLPTSLMTATSCLAHTCTCAPSICTWIIKLIQPVFFKQQPF